MVYQYADISPEVLAKAESRAEGIFQQIDLTIVWVDFRRQPHSSSQQEQDELDSTDAVLRIAPRSRAALQSSALGEALPCQLGKDACIANVFMNRVEEQTNVEKIGVDQMLGHAIAHEIGHLLLGSNSHNSSGLMKAKWGPQDMKSAAKGNLLFTPKQARRMRANLSKHLARISGPRIASDSAEAVENQLGESGVPR
jgi:hypothetical protein